MFSWLRALRDSLSVRFCYRTAALGRSAELKTNTAPLDIKNSLAEGEQILSTLSAVRSVKKEKNEWMHSLTDASGLNWLFSSLFFFTPLWISNVSYSWCTFVAQGSEDTRGVSEFRRDRDRRGKKNCNAAKQRLGPSCRK